MKKLSLILIFSAAAVMSSPAQKISQFNPASPLTGSEGLAGIQAAGSTTNNVQVTPAQLLTYDLSHAPFVLTTNTYSDPAWLNSLNFSKLISKPTTVSGYGITDAVTPTTGATLYDGLGLADAARIAAQASSLQKSANLSDLSNAGTARTNLGVAIGTNVQAHNSILDAIAADDNTANVNVDTLRSDNDIYCGGRVGDTDQNVSGLTMDCDTGYISVNGSAIIDIPDSYLLSSSIANLAWGTPYRIDLYPVATTGAPAYQKGAYYFDLTLNKLRIGGASAWESINTGIVSGSFSGTGTATTSFTVTIGTTQANTTYKVNVTPTSALSAAVFYISAKTTTTFTVTYLSGLTGTVTFDWAVLP